MSSESGGKQPNLEGNESPHHDHQTETAEETVGHTSTNNEVEARVPVSDTNIVLALQVHTFQWKGEH